MSEFKEILDELQYERERLHMQMRKIQSELALAKYNVIILEKHFRENKEQIDKINLLMGNYAPIDN